jgi:hypothetical protein
MERAMLHRESPVLLSDGMTYAGPRFHPRPSDDPYVVLQWRLSSIPLFTELVLADQHRDMVVSRGSVQLWDPP